MKRKDLVSALLKPALTSDTGAPAEQKPPRVAAGAVRAMGLELNRLSEEADQASALRQQLASGSVVVELDPEQVEPSFISDRLAPTDDPQYRLLVESIRKDGQKIPILVRPRPDRGGIYQIAYGHRRWHVARELGITVRAIVQVLNDAELVIAQGKENSERRNLSFIERALFAANLESAGFDRSTINAALAVQTAETTRLLAVAAAIPSRLVTSIGPAPKAGRTRWMELANHLRTEAAGKIADQTLGQPSFRRLGTDARFATLIEALRTVISSGSRAESITNTRGDEIGRFTRSGRRVRLWIDERFAPGFGDYLIRCLPELVNRFDQETDQPLNN
jgi:ParB family transcriptional regulator, chromosome partitioning protein